MAEPKMFRKGEPRYKTRGINERLPMLYQILIWDTIDNLRDSGQKLDYLQVFRIRTEDNPDREGKLLTITHSQEKPPYQKEHTIPIRADSEEVNGKIYVIDDMEYATMLWADEY